MLGITVYPGPCSAHARQHLGADPLHFQLDQNWSAAALRRPPAVAILPEWWLTGALVRCCSGACSRAADSLPLPGKAISVRAVVELGPWRWLTLALAAALFFTVVVLPTLALIVAALPPVTIHHHGRQLVRDARHLTR